MFAVSKKHGKSKYELRNQSLELLNNTASEIRESGESHAKLQREFRELALDRIEKSARTQVDFEKIINIWGLAESNRERKERDYRAYNVKFYKRDEDGAEMETSDTPSIQTMFPAPLRALGTRYWQQVLKGDFLDYIFDCKATLHEVTTRHDLCEALKLLNDNQKEIFYSIAIDGKTPQQVAKYRGQTDRNIRKVYSGAIQSIYKKYREKAIKYHEKGNSVRLTAETFGISPNTLNTWLKKYRENGDLSRKYRSYKSVINEEELLEYLKNNSDAYQKEIGEHFGCHQATVCRSLKRLKITRKKR